MRPAAAEIIRRLGFDLKKLNAIRGPRTVFSSCTESVAKHRVLALVGTHDRPCSWELTGIKSRIFEASSCATKIVQYECGG
jgi:hypothetical protein